VAELLGGLLNKGLEFAHGTFGKVAIEGSSAESMEIVIGREKRRLRNASKNTNINNDSQGLSTSEMLL
jgi:hypothetical protein